MEERTITFLLIHLVQMVYVPVVNLFNETNVRLYEHFNMNIVMKRIAQFLLIITCFTAYLAILYYAFISGKEEKTIIFSFLNIFLTRQALLLWWLYKSFNTLFIFFITGITGSFLMLNSPQYYLILLIATVLSLKPIKTCTWISCSKKYESIQQMIYIFGCFIFNIIYICIAGSSYRAFMQIVVLAVSIIILILFEWRRSVAFSIQINQFFEIKLFISFTDYTISFYYSDKYPLYMFIILFITTELVDIVFMLLDPSIHVGRNGIFFDLYPWKRQMKITNIDQIDGQFDSKIKIFGRTYNIDEIIDLDRGEMPENVLYLDFFDYYNYDSRKEMNFSRNSDFHIIGKCVLSLFNYISIPKSIVAIRRPAFDFYTTDSCIIIDQEIGRAHV